MEGRAGDESVTPPSAGLVFTRQRTLLDNGEPGLQTLAVWLESDTQGESDSPRDLFKKVAYEKAAQSIQLVKKNMFLLCSKDHPPFSRHQFACQTNIYFLQLFKKKKKTPSGLFLLTLTS